MKQLFGIIFLGVFFALGLNFGLQYFVGANSLSDSSFFSTWNQQEKNNNTQFKQAGEVYLWATGVALSVNIGTRFLETYDYPQELSLEILNISEILSRKDIAQGEIIANHMVRVHEYYNILRTDIPNLLARSPDREAMLMSFIDQLKYRYVTTTKAINILNNQGWLFTQTRNTARANIATLKSELSQAYAQIDHEEVISIIKEYNIEKKRETDATTYIVFIEKFIQSYEALNNYNRVLLDTLINNQEALIKNTTVVIPDSGTELLSQFKLIQEESEWKNR